MENNSAYAPSGFAHRLPEVAHQQFMGLLNWNSPKEIKKKVQANPEPSNYAHRLPEADHQQFLGLLYWNSEGEIKMGVDIYSHIMVAVPFTEYKVVSKTEEQVRYNEYTGEKKVTSINYKEYIWEGKKYEDFFNIIENIQQRHEGVEVYEIGDKVYIGFSVVYMDCKNSEGLIKTINLNDVQRHTEKLRSIFNIEPQLISFIEYN